MMPKTIAASLIFCLFTYSASYGVVIYQDFDPGADSTDPRPNSIAEAAAFDTAAGALGVVNLIDFETVPLGFATNRVIAPGVVAQFVGTAGGSGIIDGTGTTIQGYNTTLAGSRYLRVDPFTGNSGVRFNFADPIDAFGAYITGLGTASGNLTAQFTDGSLVVLPIAGDDDGGVQFFGFTNAGASISSVFLRFQGAASDIFSVDDLRYVTVPEPSTWLLAGLGIACPAAIRLRRRTP
jgi:hypothetical protein